MDRNAFIGALYDHVAAALGITKASRTLLHWSDVSEQPALFTRYRGEQLVRNPSGLRGPRELNAEIWLYTRGDERVDKNSELSLYTCLEAIEASLSPSPITNTQTLGGIVIDCWIQGIDAGFEPGGQVPVIMQAVAVLDVTMLIAY